MKFIAALSLSAVLAIGLSATAGAAPIDDVTEIENAGTIAGSVEAHPYHPCHGRASGTSHRDCSTQTGGPAGGLF